MLFNFSSKRKVAYEDRKPIFSFFGSTPTAGVEVDNETALKYSTFWACVKIISETIAYLPWHVHQEGNKKRAFSEHHLDNIIYKRPNYEQNSFIFKELMYRQALTWGNFYAEIERNGLGDIVNLWPIDASRVDLTRDSSGRLVYDVANQGASNSALYANDIFHVKGPSPDGIRGYSIIEMAKESISMGLAAESFGASFFGNGAIPGTVITNDGTAKLDKDGIKNLKATWNREHKGPRNRHKTEYLDRGLKVQPIGIPPGDAQFIETRQFQNTEMCRWFRMPPHKVADLLRATHNNIESSNIEFVTDAILPWVTRCEKEADFRLLGHEPRLYTKMKIMGLLRGDSAARKEYYKALADLGVLSIDEIRELEDLDPLEKDGDLRMVQVNRVTLERMKRGELGTSGKSTASVASIIEEQAERFCKFELNKVAKFDLRSSDNEIVNFYAEHAKSCADGFYRSSVALCDVLGKDSQKVDQKLKQFFGNYCSDSAETIKNSIVSDNKVAVLSSWKTRKPQTLARDLINYLKEA